MEALSRLKRGWAAASHNRSQSRYRRSPGGPEGGEGPGCLRSRSASGRGRAQWEAASLRSPQPPTPEWSGSQATADSAGSAQHSDSRRRGGPCAPGRGPQEAAPLPRDWPFKEEDLLRSLQRDCKSSRGWARPRSGSEACDFETPERNPQTLEAATLSPRASPAGLCASVRGLARRRGAEGSPSLFSGDPSEIRGNESGVFRLPTH